MITKDIIRGINWLKSSHEKILHIFRINLAPILEKNVETSNIKRKAFLVKFELVLSLRHGDRD